MALTSTMIAQLNNSNMAHQRAQIGTLLGQLGPLGDVYYLDPANGSDAYAGTAPASAFASMETAYAALTASQNDVLVYIAGATSLVLQEQLVWAKSYTHLVGACAPTRTAQRARIFQLSTLTGLSPLINITASGCIFKDFYVFQGVNDATSLANVGVTGGRNYFENVHFAGGGHATQAINGGCSLLLTGAEENTFKGCTFGVDTVAAATGMAAVVIASASASTRNRFLDCDFTLYAGHAGAKFIELMGNGGLDRYMEFVDCRFINLSTTTMTEVFTIAGGFDASNKRFLLSGDYAKIGATKWDDTDSGAVFGRLAATSAADSVGDYTELIT